MNGFCSSWLRYLMVLFCLLASLVSWQASAVDEVYTEHRHCASHDDNHHDQNQNDDHHHCPNCSAHFVGLALNYSTVRPSQLNTYQAFLSDGSLLRIEAPPTPPPNS